MSNITNKKINPDLFIPGLYILFMISLVFSLRGVSSITIGCLLIGGLLIKRHKKRNFLSSTTTRIFLFSCFAFFLINTIALAYTHHLSIGWKHARIQSAFLVMPLALCVTIDLLGDKRRKLLLYYCWILVAASVFCLLVAIKKYIASHDQSVFFYHKLVSPLSQHAIYFSILTVIGLSFLLENFIEKQYLIKPSLHTFLIVYLSAFLLLLSSKLVILIYVAYVTECFIRIIRRSKEKRMLIIGPAVIAAIVIGSVFLARNEISNRYYEILEGDMKLVRQERFDKNIYFNGLQFRLLQWKFVPEILSENKSWWKGVSPGDAQLLLDKKYVEKNMYTGDPSKGTVGYQVYNTHNQFLETLLQTGIIGLIILAILVAALLRLGWQGRDRVCLFACLALFAWLFTESVLERQYGIMIFFFFPLFLYPSKKQDVIANTKPTFSEIKPIG